MSMTNSMFTLREYMEAAYGYATLSPIMSNQHGCVIVIGDKVVSGGCNRFVDDSKPDDVINSPQFDCYRPIYAEIVAIAEAASRGINLTGATIVGTSFPKIEAINTIKLAGIDRIVYHFNREEQNSPTKFNKMNRGMAFAYHLRINITRFVGTIGCEPVMVNSNPWNP